MDLAANFSLPDTNGVIHRLADYAGQWLLLVFHRHLA
jgi:peroxiredoxin